MKPCSALLAFLIFSSSWSAFAHEGHEHAPVVPSAPHGGKLKEAIGLQKGETQLYFEAVFQDPTLKIYPLTLNGPAFKSLPPKDLSKVAVEVEFPRSGKRNKIDMRTGPESLEAVVNPKGANRFVVSVTAVHKGETKKAKIQMELR